MVNEVSGKEEKGLVQRQLVHVRTFLQGKKGNKGLTAARQQEQFLGQTTLIKFV